MISGSKSPKTLRNEGIACAHLSAFISTGEPALALLGFAVGKGRQVQHASHDLLQDIITDLLGGIHRLSNVSTHQRSKGLLPRRPRHFITIPLTLTLLRLSFALQTLDDNSPIVA